MHRVPTCRPAHGVFRSPRCCSVNPVMTVDAWAIIGTGVALAVLITYLFAWLRSDMKEGHRTLEERLRAVEHEQARV